MKKVYEAPKLEAFGEVKKITEVDNLHSFVDKMSPFGLFASFSGL